MIKLSTKAISFFFLLFISTNCTYLPAKKEVINLKVIQKNSPAFKGFLGINAFEWDFLDNTSSNPDEVKVKIMQSFGAFRHYMDWERIEPEKGKYSFNPTHSGGFNYDAVYQTCKKNDIEVLSCLKTCTSWIMNTYPKDERDNEDVPATYGLSRSDPTTYVDQAKAAFQFAARYGNNKKIDTTLIHTKIPAWNTDPGNIAGLGYVHYIECNNEVDRTWKGKKAQQSPDEYAANLSAFYDGDMGKMGKDVGVKNADPAMKVVMSGLASPNPDFVVNMIEWCKKHRGYKADGSVNLCFDVINYHFYNNDASPGRDNRTTGKAPELSLAGKEADDFVAMSKKYANNIDVWITESGYDINPGSPQRAIAIGNKSALITQADWMLRSAFLYARHGLKRSFFYMLDDAGANQPGPYATSGFASDNKKRPVADYFLQTKKILGEYSYEQTISKDPIVDIYSKDNKKIYVLYVPDEVDRKASYDVDLHGCTSAKVYHFVPGADDMKTEVLPVKNGKIRIDVTETPVFVEGVN